MNQPGTSLSPTAGFRARAAALRAAGGEVYDLSAGELSFPTPAHIVAAAVEASGVRRHHRYGPVEGDPALQRAVARRLAVSRGLDADPTMVLITHGAKQALINTLHAILAPGDEVIVPAPCWATYPSAIRLAHGRPRIVRPSIPRTAITTRELTAAWTPATKAIILCSPSNPTGQVYAPGELRPILDWSSEREIRVIADETYVDLAFVPVPALAPMLGPAARSLITIGSVSKSFAMTGWRVGWIHADPAIVARAAAVQSHTTSNVCGINQAAALAALEGPDVTADFRAALRHRLDLCLSMLQPAGLPLRPPDGAFYLLPDVSAFGRDSSALVERLLDRGVVTVPGEPFGAPGSIRLSFAISEEELIGGLGRLVDVLAALDGNRDAASTSRKAGDPP